MVKRLDNQEQGDVRIGAKLLEFREEFHVPRRTLSKMTGIHVTSITRIELGQRGFSDDSLAKLIAGGRELVALIAPARMKTYVKWVFELCEVISTVKDEQKLARKIVREQRKQAEAPES